MRQLLSVEHLKMKRTMLKKLLILAPLGTMVIAFLAGSYFYSCALNWWYTIFFPVVLAIICVQIQEKEKKKLNYQNLYMSPVPLSKIWTAKTLLAAGYSLFTCVFLSGIVIVAAKVLGVTMKTGSLTVLLAGLLMTLLCAYQIPIYLYLAKHCNFLVVFLVSIVFIVLGIMYSEKSYWIAVPSAWCNRSMYSVLHIMTNGLFLNKGEEALLVSIGSIIIAVCGCVGLFLLGTVLLGRIVKGEAEKK